MRKYLIPLLAVLLFASFASVSYAAETKAMIEKAKGTVKSIDAEKGALVVTTEAGTDMTFSIKKTQAKNVKEGDMVTVSYEKKGEEMVAKRVTRARAKKMMKKEKMKEEPKKEGY